MTDPMDDLRQASADVSGVEVLSPAAQAVLDAASNHWPGGSNHPSKRACIAAALRAAASYAKAGAYGSAPSTDWGDGWKEGVRNTAQGLLAIADELEGQQ